MCTLTDQKKALEIYFENISTDKRPWFGDLKPTKTGDFSFAVIGDRCGITTPGVFEKGLELVKRLQPDFVLSVGDFIEGYWENEADAHEEWDYVDHLLEKLELPFFQIVGNHDYGNETMVKVWRERKGFEYYAFRYHNELFLFINTEESPVGISGDFLGEFRKINEDVKREPEKSMEYVQGFFNQMAGKASKEELEKANLPNISDEQLAFFENVLKENEDVNQTFILMHKPGWKTKDTHFQHLEDMLKNRKYTMLAGHFHQLEVMKRNGHNHIQMGRTGACWHGEGIGSIDHILWVTVKNGETNFNVIELQGVSTLEKFMLDEKEGI
ncbi:metallophosphoesterase family protein [Bacillus thuringiensis]|uniref:metallophosphoesterase family protein n=1 Tax=Bacillus thuringiensis TaxID=1428 RepID=UPI002AB4ED0B|nr:metallophosphoesterase [Bacillus thuringiensis]MDY8166496.1 metallophosphoesterase [Bacillus thuringiensis]